MIRVGQKELPAVRLVWSLSKYLEHSRPTRLVFKWQFSPLSVGKLALAKPLDLLACGPGAATRAGSRSQSASLQVGAGGLRKTSTVLPALACQPEAAGRCAIVRLDASSCRCAVLCCAVLFCVALPAGRQHSAELQSHKLRLCKQRRQPVCSGWPLLLLLLLLVVVDRPTDRLTD